LPFAVTDFTREAQQLLRDGSQFKWYVVTLIALVLYVYSVEIERQRWDIVLAGLAVWLADWFNEIANALLLHITDRAALWTVTGDTAYLVLIGLTIEISMMFAIAGVIFVKQLPPDRHEKWLGINNRLWMILGFSLLPVGVEVLINSAGFFHWEYWFWGNSAIGLIPVVLLGYAWFFAIGAWVYDMGSNRKGQLAVVGTLAAIDAAALLTFGTILGWI
jgi:hypothetical protein